MNKDESAKIISDFISALDKLTPKHPEYEDLNAWFKETYTEVFKEEPKKEEPEPESEPQCNGEMKLHIHKALCDQLHAIYVAKNKDYGDSFNLLREEFPNAVLVRLSDKFQRVKTLMLKGGSPEVDESIEDTLIDLANYALMEVVARRMENER